MGDVARAYDKHCTMVKVNKEFIYIYENDYIKAKKIFQENRSINAIPVITNEGVLIGDYTRWDDLLVVKQILQSWKGKNYKHLFEFHSVALVSSVFQSEDKRKLYYCFKEYLLCQNVRVDEISYSDIPAHIDFVDIILIVDENELRGVEFSLRITKGVRYEKVDTMLNTYHQMLLLNKKRFIVERISRYLKDLCRKGVCVMGLDTATNSYVSNLYKQIQDKCEVSGFVAGNKLPEERYIEFFDNLYSKEYAEDILGIPFQQDYVGGVPRLRDCQSQYYNVSNGERYTNKQPDSFEKTIYFFGPCYIYGAYVEDKYTIESFLQKRLNEKGYKIRVINYGNFAEKGLFNTYGWFCFLAVTDIKKGDVVVIGDGGERAYSMLPMNIEGVKYLKLADILEKNKVEYAWLINYLQHCNHKVNALYADAIYDVLEPSLKKKMDGQGELIEKDDNFVKLLYLDQYFTDFDASQFEHIGAVVMNCNPFTYGHRHLIEQALKLVDYLIIFVVEEDKSVFSFAERFTFVQQGVRDLDNVMVVPSGPYILSKKTFPEYFIKETGEDMVLHTKQDIMTFAEKIAPQLGITHRFVGEEPLDIVTNQYNQTMKEILPKYGIKVVEISRKAVSGYFISASLARQSLEQGDIERILELLPETTLQILGI